MTAPSPFAGKRYWVLGASEGLGRALAQALDAQGARLLLSARNAGRLAELASSLRDAECLPFDVTDSTSVAAIAGRIGQLDGIIYSVGLYEPMRAQAWNTEAAVAMAEANFVGALRVLGLCLPGFIAQDAGHVVLIGSLAGFRGLPGAIGYGAGKAGLMHLAETLDADLHRTGVRVQMINPGFIATRLTAKNDFAMPQIMAPQAAAAAVLAAMRSRRFTTSFPRPFAWLFRAAPMLPRRLYLRLFA
ncbi:MAG: SDR family NAD(P)-dependent oxidoreductase [Rhodobacteraceae bacterium]|nr:SDR family NAD(P)-dependent oxidoreductase [Paracoccaceae bacterium]